MLAKKYRLPARVSTKDFSIFPEDLFNLKIGKNKTKESRFGFVVAKSTDKRAVVRNRLKRQFRRFVEENYNRIKPGYDFLFRIKVAAKDQTTKEIHSRIEKRLKNEEFIK